MHPALPNGCLNPPSLRRLKAKFKPLVRATPDGHHTKTLHLLTKRIITVLNMASQKLCEHKYMEKYDTGLCCLSCGTVRNSIFAEFTTAPSHDEYQYIPLKRSPKEIRLVALLPGRGSDPICCRIITVQLDHCPYYTAASYTWATEDGDATRVHTVQVYIGMDFNIERTIRITTNCRNTLRQLRRADCIRHVWLDAICINQGHTSERNHQVSIMDQIYRKAAAVAICVQRTGHDYQGALDLLAPDGASRDKLKLLTLSELQERPEVLQLMSLFDARYFSRVWVIQEVLSAEVAILHVNDGTVRFTGEALKALDALFQAVRLDVPRLPRWASIWSRNSDIISLLSMSLNCSASDPRDKVFAIVSLLQQHIRSMISIEYMATTQEVFTQAVMACIHACGDLEILSFAEVLSEERKPAEASFTMENFLQFLQQRKARSDLQDWSRSLMLKEQSQGAGSYFLEEALRRGKPIKIDMGDLEEALRCREPIKTDMGDLDDQSRSDLKAALSLCDGRFPTYAMMTSSTVVQSQMPSAASTSQKRRFERCDPISYHSTACGDACKWTSTQTRVPSTAVRETGRVPPTQVLPRLQVFSQLLDSICDASFNPTASHFLETLRAIRDSGNAQTWPWLRTFCKGPARSSVQSAVHLDEQEMNIIRHIFREMSKIVDGWDVRKLRVFRTDELIGVASGSVLTADAIFAVEGASTHFVLREIHPGLYRILSRCYCWTADGVLEDPFNGRDVNWGEGVGFITLF
jgi:hypothetical protein